MMDEDTAITCSLETEQLGNLAHRLDYADAAFETYFELKYGSKKWGKVYSQYGAFWAITIKALMENALLYVYEISKPLGALLSQSIKRKPANLEELKTINKEFRNLKKFDDLRKIRDKLLAHFDLDFQEDSSADQLFAQYNIKIDDIRYMIQLERRICNAIAGDNISTRYHNYNDVSRVLMFNYRHIEKELALAQQGK